MVTRRNRRREKAVRSTQAKAGMVSSHRAFSARLCGDRRALPFALATCVAKHPETDTVAAPRSTKSDACRSRPSATIFPKRA